MPAAPSPPRRADTALVASLALLYVLAYGTACLVKYRYFLYCDFDLAIFAQATDGILRGTLFSSIRGMPWLGDHASLILFPVAPLYALFRDARTLLVLQTLALAAGAFAAHRLAWTATGRRADAIAFAGLYLMFPALGYTNLFEFHPETLATAPLLFAFAFAHEGRTRATLVMAAIALLAREDVALAVLGLAAHLALTRPPRWRATAIAIAAAAALSLVISFVVLRPMFNAGGAEYGKVYAQWGATTGAAIAGMVTQPFRVIASLFSVPGDPAHTTAKLQFWLHLLLPLGFLPLLAPATLVAALPMLFEHLLAWRPAQHTIVYQYTALLTPAFVAAAVQAYTRLTRAPSAAARASKSAPAKARDRAARGRGASAQRAEAVRGAATASLPAGGAVRPFLIVVVACALVSQIAFGPLFGLGAWQTLKSFESTWPTGEQRQRAVALAELMHRVPARGGVVAGFELLPRFVSRDSLHSAHHVFLGRYTFSERPYPVPRGIAALICDPSDRTLLGAVNATTGQRLQELCAANDLHPSAAIGEMMLWTRAARDTVELMRPGAPAIPREPPAIIDGAVALVGHDPWAGSVRAGDALTMRLGWKRVGEVRRLFPIRLELLDARGVRVASQLHPMGYSVWPPHTWPADSTWIETVRFVMPADLAAGTDTVALSVQPPNGRGTSLVEDPLDPARDGRVRLGVVRVLAR